MEVLDLNTATDEQLEAFEALLAKKKEAKRRAQQREKKRYERERDDTIEMMMAEAEDISQRIKRFKSKCHVVMDAQELKLNEYGDMPGRSKGGFSITHADGERRIVRLRSTQPFWDERSIKAVELIKEFLYDTVKKRDLDTFEMLMTFLQKNKAGDLEYRDVMTLLQHEGRYNDKRWIEGLRLLKESYSVHLRGFRYDFKTKSRTGWQTLDLSFSTV